MGAPRHRSSAHLRPAASPRTRSRKDRLRRVHDSGRVRTSRRVQTQQHDSRNHRRVHQRQRILHHRSPRLSERVRPCAVPHARCRLPGQHPAVQLAGEPYPAPVALHPHHGLPRLDEPTRLGPDGQRDVDRTKPRQGLHDRPSFHHLCRRRRLRRRQDRDQRSGRLPAHARAIQRNRRPSAEGHPSGRSAGNRQDPLRPRRGRRSWCRLLVGHRIGLHGDVRGRGRESRARFVPAGAQDGPRHHLHRRDRLDRP